MAYSMNNKAKLERLQPEMVNISKELMTEVAAAQEMYGWDSNIAKSQFRINVRNVLILTVLNCINRSLITLSQFALNMS